MSVVDLLLDDLGERRADCDCCYVVDLVGLDRIKARLRAVEGLAHEYDRYENWRIWGVPAAIRRALVVSRVAANPTPPPKKKTGRLR